MDTARSRRDVLKMASSAALIAAASPLLAADYSPAKTVSGDRWHGLKVGLASYSLRKLNVDDAVKAMKRLGVKYVSPKDIHLPTKGTPEQLNAGVAKFTSAGITPLSAGVVYTRNSETSVHDALQYAKECGIPTLVISPDPASLGVYDKLIKEFDLRVAIHNHGPGDKWPTPYEVMEAIKNLDPRIGVCIDVGHTARAKADPAEAILKCKERVFDVHMKDLASTEVKAEAMPVGRGVLDIKSMLRALVEIKYPHLVSLEYERDADDPVPGIGESLGYLNGVLDSLA